MSDIGQAFSSGLQGAPVGGTADATGNAGSDFGAGSATPFGGFNSFNDLVNAFSGGSGGNPPIVTAQAPGGGSPLDAQSGTQSNTSPGGRNPEQNQQQQQAPPGAQPNVPPQAIQSLRDLLNKLAGKPIGPTGFVPQPPHTPTVPGVLNALFGKQAADARTPPNPDPDQAGRDVTIHSKVPIPTNAFRPEDDPSAPPPAPPAPVPPAPVPPADKPGPPMQLPQGPQPAPPAAPVQLQPQHISRLMRDLAGISQGNPTSLLDLAQALYPIIGGARIAASGGRPIGQDVSFAGPGEIQDFMKQARGETFEGGAQAGFRKPVAYDKFGHVSDHGAFGSQGEFIGSPEKAPTSGQIPGVTPQIADAYIRQGAQNRSIDPNIASKVLGAESGYGQNNINQRDVNGYPDYGPMQLNTAPGALGDQFYKDTGQRPEDFAQNWRKQIDYALDAIQKHGWSDLYPLTSKKLGLDRWTGIQRRVSANSPTPPRAGGGFTLPGEHLPVG